MSSRRGRGRHFDLVYSVVGSYLMEPQSAEGTCVFSLS